MKLIYRGGYNKHNENSIKKSLFYEYNNWINKQTNSGKQICFVTYAKPAHYYDKYIISQFDSLIEVIEEGNNNIDWAKYDIIILLGGSQTKLMSGLQKSGFNMERLKKDVIIIGDSAGAFVLSAYMIIRNQVDQTTLFVPALYPQSNVITLAHTNNTVYFSSELLKETRKFAREKKLKVLLLKENEAKLLNESGEFIDFNITEI